MIVALLRNFIFDILLHKLQKVIDLQFSEVCHMGSQDSEDWSELYLYLVIFGEASLILLVIAKVWHDQRTFRRTGILPWFSARMPRLPCDAMLETVKEPPNLNNRYSGSVGSSNTNVHNVSGSVQMRDARYSGSGGGGSLYSIQPRCSSYPSSSSRTSSV